MATIVLNTFMVLGHPIEVLLGGDPNMSDPSGLAAAMTQRPPGDQRRLEPLNPGWFGYRLEGAKKCWPWRKGAGCRAGEKFFTLGLLLSLIYGGLLAVSLGWVWLEVGRPFHPAWIGAPLAIILTADWTEQLIQVAQLRHYLSSDEVRIQNFWIEVFSCATMIRVWVTLGLYVSLIGLVAKKILSLSERHLVADAAE